MSNDLFGHNTSFIETFIIGMFGSVILIFVGIIFYLLFKSPLLFLLIFCGCLLVYIVGWCMDHYAEFYDLFAGYNVSEPKKFALPSYGVQVLDDLQRLETKYNISTLKFMSFVYNGFMPYGMDNLDYIEWVALVGQLSASYKKED